MRLQQRLKPGRMRALDGTVRRWCRAGMLSKARGRLAPHVGPDACDLACATTELQARRRKLAQKAIGIIDKLEAKGKLKKGVAEHDARAHMRAMQALAEKDIYAGGEWLQNELSHIDDQIKAKQSEPELVHLLKRQRWILRALRGDWKAYVLRDVVDDEAVCKDGHCLG